MSAPEGNMIPDTELGLTPEEILILRQAQQQLGAAGSTSSRAASRASSQGMLLMDASSLDSLALHLNRVVADVHAQMQFLDQEVAASVERTRLAGDQLMDMADAEISNYEALIARLDELELDFDRVQNIRAIVQGFRQRVETLERDLNMSQSTSAPRRDKDKDGGGHPSKHGHSHSHRHGHGHGHSSRHGHSSSSKQRR